MKDFNLIDFMMHIFVFLGIVIFLVFIYFLINYAFEMQCVDYYKSSGYVLEQCEVFEGKLKEIEVSE